jgi:hypothetical protein
MGRHAAAGQRLSGAKSLPTTARYRTSETKKKTPQRPMCEERARRPNNAPSRVSVYRSYRRACRSGGFGVAEVERSGSWRHS